MHHVIIYNYRLLLRSICSFADLESDIDRGRQSEVNITFEVSKTTYWPKQKSIIVILHTKVILLRQEIAIATSQTFSGVNIGFRSQYHFLLTPHVTCLDQSKLCLHTRYVIFIVTVYCYVSSRRYLKTKISFSAAWQMTSPKPRMAR